MTRTTTRALFAITAMLAATACGGGSKTAAAPGAAPAPAANNAAAAAKVAPAAAKLPATVTPAMIALGDSIFNNGSCQRCHGKGGIGAANAPAFKGIKWQHGNGSFEDIVKTVVNGVPATEIKDPTNHKFPMGARGGRMPLTDDQIKAVSAYVFTISR